MFSVYTKIYARNTGFIPVDKSIEKIEKFTEDKGIFWGFLLALAGIVISIVALVYWSRTGFGDLNPQIVMRFTIPAFTLIVVGIQLIFGSFFIGILNIPLKKS